MTGLDWLGLDEACDLLRVSADNERVIDAFAATIPYYVEITTGYPAYLTASTSCSETAKTHSRFLLCLWFNPDGTDAEQLKQVIDSLTKALKAHVIAHGYDED